MDFRPVQGRTGTGRLGMVCLGRMEGKLTLCNLLLVWLCPAGGLRAG